MAEDAFVKALKRRRQISITVTGRRTGRAITIPVWFVSDDRTHGLLPVHSSHTQWYRNLKKDRLITIQAGMERTWTCLLLTTCIKTLGQQRRAHGQKQAIPVFLAANLPTRIPAQEAILDFIPANFPSSEFG